MNNDCRGLSAFFEFYMFIHEREIRWEIRNVTWNIHSLSWPDQIGSHFFIIILYFWMVHRRETNPGKLTDRCGLLSCVFKVLKPRHSRVEVRHIAAVEWSLTDEVDGHGWKLSLCKSITESLLLDAALHMRIHDNVGQLGVFDQGLRNKMVTAKKLFWSST